MRWGIMVALVLSCAVGLAEEPAADAPKEADPVQEKIEAATQRYYEAIEKIEKDLCRQIDAMVESYADRGELEIVLELQDQKKQFLESGYPPAAPVFANNRHRAQIEITKTVNRMDRAYSDVIAELTKKRDFASATRMRDEWKEILATINPKIGDGFEAFRQAKLQKAGLAERKAEKVATNENPLLIKNLSEPINFQVQTPSNNQFIIYWDPPLEDGDSAVIGYVLSCSRNGEPWMSVNVDAAAHPSYKTAVGMRKVPHDFRVAAVNGKGQGPWSPIISAIPGQK